MRLMALGLVVLFALTGALLPATTAAATPRPGSVSPVISNTPGVSTFSAGATAAGWARGSLTVSYTLYVSGSSGGPWTKITTLAHTCTNSTFCAPPKVGGYCANGWYRVVGHASGPGGPAENDGRSVTKHIYGGISTIAPARPDRPEIDPECYDVYENI